MGLFNLIKLANDYKKAKQFLENKKGDVERVKVLVEKIKSFIGKLEDYKNQFMLIINDVKDVLKELETIVRKEGK